MKATKVLGLVLLILGVLALAYGGFTYTDKTHDAEVGPVEIEVRDRDRVHIPAWAGAAVVVAGVVLLARKS